MAAVAVSLLCACTVGPDYRRPDVIVPAGWRTEVMETAPTLGDAWWEQFSDPVIDDLVKSALAENKDVRIAAARVDQSLGVLGATRSELYPQLAATFDASRQRQTRDSGVQQIPRDVDVDFNYYRPLLQASWEIDLWGRVRRATEAARGDLFASESARRGVVLTLVSQVLNNYIQLRDLDRELEIAQDTVRSRGESLRVFTLRFERGVVSQMELAQAQSEYDTAVASIPTLQQQIAATENALSILLGRVPGSIPRGRPIDSLAVPTIPVGLPSEILQRRPDILQAEQQLIAANARIGVARAAYFPAITLTGALGGASSDLSRVFSSSNVMWSLAAGVTAPIFNAGLIAGNVAQAEATQQQALFNYQKTILTAFSDVDTALSATQRSRENQDALGRTVASLTTYARLARLRYDNGYTGYLEVTDAESRLFQAQLSYVSAERQVLSSIVSVYASLGGGWIDVADRSTPTGSTNQPPLGEREQRLPWF